MPRRSVPRKLRGPSSWEEHRSFAVFKRGLALILVGLSGATVAVFAADQPSGAESGPCTLPIANCTTEQPTPTEQPTSTEQTPPSEAPTPTPQDGKNQQAPPPSSKSGDGETSPIPPDAPSDDEAVEQALLESLGGSEKRLSSEMRSFTDCPEKGKPAPGTECYRGLSFASTVLHRFNKEVGLDRSSPVPISQFVGAVAALAGMHDNSNSKPPTWAFPSVHAALPVLIKLAQWAQTNPDETKAHEAQVAARRLAQLLVRNDLGARKLK